MMVLSSLTSVLVALVLVSANAAVNPKFSCDSGPGHSIFECICSTDNAQFTSTLCSYWKKANSTGKATEVFNQLHDPAATMTLFAVNNSAYAGLTDAESSAYQDALELSLEYLVVNQTLTLNSLKQTTSGKLVTVAGSTQIILVTSASNKTILNDDESCVVDNCPTAGINGTVCLVNCVLAPSAGLTTIAIIGIVVAGVAAVCLIVACLFNIFRKDPDAEDPDAAATYQSVDDRN